jgi:hypothetical protein
VLTYQGARLEAGLGEVLAMYAGSMADKYIELVRGGESKIKRGSRNREPGIVG